MGGIHRVLLQIQGGSSYELGEGARSLSLQLYAIFVAFSRVVTENPCDFGGFNLLYCSLKQESAAGGGDGQPA